MKLSSGADTDPSLAPVPTGARHQERDDETHRTPMRCRKAVAALVGKAFDRRCQLGRWLT